MLYANVLNRRGRGARRPAGLGRPAEQPSLGAYAVARYSTTGATQTGRPIRLDEICYGSQVVSDESLTMRCSQGTSALHCSRRSSIVRIEFNRFCSADKK